MSDERRATLDGVEGSGYAVVESLASLGKGRRCTGVFVADGAEAERFARARDGRRRVPFVGPVHSRHVTRRVELAVEVTAARGDPDEGVTVEFTAHDVPYDLGG